MREPVRTRTARPLPPAPPQADPITTEVLPPIDLEERFGASPDVDAVYEHVTSVMQDALDRLADERTLPILG